MCLWNEWIEWMIAQRNGWLNIYFFLFHYQSHGGCNACTWVSVQVHQSLAYRAALSPDHVILCIKPSTLNVNFPWHSLKPQWNLRSHISLPVLKFGADFIPGKLWKWWEKSWNLETWVPFALLTEWPWLHYVTSHLCFLVCKREK